MAFCLSEGWRHLSFAVLLFSLLPTAARAQTKYIISTVVGTGEPGYNGDGIPAIDARLTKPSGIAVDGSGNLFIADGGNHRVRKVNRDGVITTIAGTGDDGFDGDGGPAIKARVGCPYSARPAGDGSVLIADVCANRIRQVLPSGMIRTIAGGGGTDLGDGGPAINASLAHPDDVITDSQGNIFIADTVHNRIRKVDRNGKISTIAGTGPLADDGESRYVGDGGSALNAMLNLPDALALDSLGNLYFAELHNHVIRKISPDGIISTAAGDGRAGYNGDSLPARQARLHTPTGVAVVPDGTLLIADSDNYRIRAVLPDGRMVTLAGLGKPGFNGDGRSADQSAVGVLDLVTVDRAGNIYLADYGNNRIRRLSPIGKESLRAQ
jgi:sugar lactone lactonase YvrE